MKKATFLKYANSRWRMRLFMWIKLPMAAFANMYVVECSETQCTVALPYGWRSQNPFRSVYFAAQCGAAEMSTGLLALAALQEQPPVSMLIVGLEAAFLKKADSTIHFTCTDGDKIAAAIQATIATGAPQALSVEVAGMAGDTMVSKMTVSWSFKRK